MQNPLLIRFLFRRRFSSIATPNSDASGSCRDDSTGNAGAPKWKDLLSSAMSTPSKPGDTLVASPPQPRLIQQHQPVHEQSQQQPQQQNSDRSLLRSLLKQKLIANSINADIPTISGKLCPDIIIHLVLDFSLGMVETSNLSR